jgi:NAD-dependent deacetylase
VDKILRKTVDLLRDARHVAVLTGAGMSAESGVPTFRDAQTGLWAKFDPEELATAGAFAESPSRVFGWYVSRLRTVHQATPHAGYDALVRMAALYPGGFDIVTQNVDGLHGRAGSEDVVELHGSLEAFRCSSCREPYSAEKVIELWEGEGEILPPGCRKCGNFIRPGVVWFGEMLAGEVLERATDVAYEADVALVIGTSSLVYPAAGLPEIVRARGGRVIEINPKATHLTPRVDLYWETSAGEALPQLADALHGQKDGKTA